MLDRVFAFVIIPCPAFCAPAMFHFAPALAPGLLIPGSPPANHSGTWPRPAPWTLNALDCIVLADDHSDAPFASLSPWLFFLLSHSTISQVRLWSPKLAAYLIPTFRLSIHRSIDTNLVIVTCSCSLEINSKI
jgi:hypothetical protein